MRCFPLAHLLPLLVLFSVAAPSAPAESEPNVSIDDPVYGFLDRLEDLGFLETAILGIRPLGRGEVARLLIEAEGRVEALAPGRRELLREISLYKTRFRWCVEARGGFGRAPRLLHPLRFAGPPEDALPESRPAFLKPGVYVMPCSKLSFRTTFLDGTFSPEGQEGRRIERGMQSFGSISAHGRLASPLCFHIRPEIRVGPEGNTEDPESSLLLREFYLKASGFGLDLQVGVDDLVWGPGRHGQILLSRNAGSLHLAKLGTPSPFRLPWIFSYVGDIRFELFAARLERARAVPHALLGGLKVNLKPLPWMELGLSRTAVFGGETRPAVTPEMLWRIWWGKYDNPDPGEEELSNQLAGFDGRFRLRVLGVGLTLYGEAIGEDETNMFPYKWSTILGLRVAGLPPDGKLDLRVEWAHTHRVAYRHGTYATGYRYRGELLGHHVDRDGKDIYLEAEVHPLPGLHLSIYADWEARRQNGSFQPVEEHLQIGTSAAWDHLGGFGLSVRIEYRYRHVRNAGYVKGQVWDEHALGLCVQWTP
jgi:hypothetical protein